MHERRKVIRVAVGTIWVTPIISSVILPAHATMSNMNWKFDISYSENCAGCGWELGDENGEITTISPPQKEERIFEVSDKEIESGEFNKTYDADGNGAAADFFGYEISITEITENKIFGSIERSSVDVPDLYRGNFEASKI